MFSKVEFIRSGQFTQGALHPNGVRVWPRCFLLSFHFISFHFNCTVAYKIKVRWQALLESLRLKADPGSRLAMQSDLFFFPQSHCCLSSPPEPLTCCAGPGVVEPVPLQMWRGKGGGGGILSSSFSFSPRRPLKWSRCGARKKKKKKEKKLQSIREECGGVQMLRCSRLPPAAL